MSAPVSYQRSGPWDHEDTFYFYGGAFSSFAPTPGLRLPGGWFGHPRPAPLFDVAYIESYFQACKADSLEDFLWVLTSPRPAQAKRRGGPRGEGRKIGFRRDWEEVKYEVMRFAHGRKFETFPTYREELLATGVRPLVENSPTDFIWGGRDRDGGYDGRNLLGLALMEIRSDLRGDARPRCD